MKVIIAGGRDYPWDFDNGTVNSHFSYLDDQRLLIPITEVVCGMAKGADTLGYQWATLRGIPVAKFPADWKKYGKAAGPIRNRQMAEYADALLAFPGGAGTANMITQMSGLKKLVRWARVRD